MSGAKTETPKKFLFTFSKQKVLKSWIVSAMIRPQEREREKSAVDADSRISSNKSNKIKLVKLAQAVEGEDELMHFTRSVISFHYALNVFSFSETPQLTVLNELL